MTLNEFWNHCLHFVELVIWMSHFLILLTKCIELEKTFAVGRVRTDDSKEKPKSMNALTVQLRLRYGNHYPVFKNGVWLKNDLGAEEGHAVTVYCRSVTWPDSPTLQPIGGTKTKIDLWSNCVSQITWSDRTSRLQAGGSVPGMIWGLIGINNSMWLTAFLMLLHVFETDPGHLPRVKFQSTWS